MLRAYCAASLLWIGEDQIDGFLRKAVYHDKAIPPDDRIEGERLISHRRPLILFSV